MCIPSENESSSISFASINENYATADTICYFGNGKNHELLFSNINNNFVNGQARGLINTQNSLVIKQCCILNNTAMIWFGVDTYDSRIVEITIINCTIEEEDLVRTTGSISMNTNGDKWQANPSFINAIKCTIDGEYCQASYDSVGNLTPDIKIPPQTPYETPSVTPEETTEETHQTYNHDVYDSLEEEDLSTSSSSLLEYMFFLCFLNQYPEYSWFYL